MINDGITVHGQPECKKHNGVYSWTMPGDKIMTNGACSELIDCSTSIPLQSKCDAGDACFAPNLSANITCPKDDQVLRHRLPANQSKYTEVKYISCDQKNDKWMADNKVVVDKSSVINCVTAVIFVTPESIKQEERKGVFIITWAVSLSIIVVFVIGLVSYWVCTDNRELTKEEINMRKRPSGSKTKLLKNIDDTSDFDDCQLVEFCNYYQFYSIYERLVVVKRIILDAKVVELFRFLQAAFVHEVDHRVWIPMLEGVKNMHYLSDKKNRPIMDSLIKSGANELLRKYGWDEKPREPFEHTFLRYIGAHLLFYIGDQDALKKLEQLYNDHYVPGDDGKPLKPELKTCLRIVVWGNAAKNLNKSKEVRALIPNEGIKNETVVDIFGTRTQHAIKAFVYSGILNAVALLMNELLCYPCYTVREVITGYTTMLELDYTRAYGLKIFFEFDVLFLKKIGGKEQQANYKEVFHLIIRNVLTNQQFLFVQDNVVKGLHSMEFLATAPFATMRNRVVNYEKIMEKMSELIKLHPDNQAGSERPAANPPPAAARPN